jgi:hypothetical protein
LRYRTLNLDMYTNFKWCLDRRENDTPEVIYYKNGTITLSILTFSILGSMDEYDMTIELHGLI